MCTNIDEDGNDREMRMDVDILKKEISSTSLDNEKMETTSLSLSISCGQSLNWIRPRIKQETE